MKEKTFLLTSALLLRDFIKIVASKYI